MSLCVCMCLSFTYDCRRNSLETAQQIMLKFCRIVRHCSYDYTCYTTKEYFVDTTPQKPLNQFCSYFVRVLVIIYKNYQTLLIWNMLNYRNTSWMQLHRNPSVVLFKFAVFQSQYVVDQVLHCEFYRDYRTSTFFVAAGDIWLHKAIFGLKFL